MTAPRDRKVRKVQIIPSNEGAHGDLGKYMSKRGKLLERTEHKKIPVAHIYHKADENDQTLVIGRHRLLKGVDW